MFKLVRFSGLSFFFVAMGSAAWANASQCDLDFKKLKICGTVHWEKAPQVVEMITPKDAAVLMIELKPKAPRTKAIPQDLEMTVKPTMPSMGGHGTEPTRVSRSTESSDKNNPAIRFQVQDIFLSMAGEWKFQVKLKSQGKELDQASWLFELK
jgi:hypothetical protein